MRDRETGRKQRDDEPSQTAWSEALLRAEEKSARGSFDGSELLSGTDAAQILDKIAPADPLGITARCRAPLHAQAHSIAQDRATTGLLAWLAPEQMETQGAA